MNYRIGNLLNAILVISPLTVDAKLKGESRSLQEATPGFEIPPPPPWEPSPWYGQPLRETKPCVSFDLDWVQAAVVKGPSNQYGLYSPECDTNSCTNGCCRAYSQVLVCDVNNDFSHLEVRHFIRNIWAYLLWLLQANIFVWLVCCQHQCVCNDITATTAEAPVEAPVSSPAPVAATTPAPVTVTTPAPVATTTPAPVTTPSYTSITGSSCTTDGDCDDGRCFQGKCFKTSTPAKQSLDTSRGGAAGGAKNGGTSTSTNGNTGARRRMRSG
jgi:hypothetical protein